MKLLNLGCGQRFHKDWVNVDFQSGSEYVIAHNLLNGIPFGSSEFDIVYHSHVLEHFSKEDGKRFILECYRVLKPRGIIRVAVPDLEQIVRNYLKSMEGALAGNVDAAYNYEWMMLELYDQTVRNYSGGEMAKYFYRDKIENEEFVYSRIGQEGRQIRKKFLESKNKIPLTQPASAPQQKTWIKKIIKTFFKNEMDSLEKNGQLAEIGKFRMGGEIHQWMYDRYSLGKLLNECGFTEISQKTAFESEIPGWNSYQLESGNGDILKPDSLFMESKKI